MDFGPFLLLASLEGAVTAAVLAPTAIGLSLVFGVMRVVNVAHGEFFMLGAGFALRLVAAEVRAAGGSFGHDDEYVILRLPIARANAADQVAASRNASAA